MTTDIVERLRAARCWHNDVMREAADEIERLRSDLRNAIMSDTELCKVLEAEIERLRTENKRLWEGLDAMVNPKPDGNASMRGVAKP
jgi:signal transduction histidine kinase